MAYSKNDASDLHIDYKENVSNWEYFLRSYNGGYDYKAGQYLLVKVQRLVQRSWVETESMV